MEKIKFENLPMNIEQLSDIAYIDGLDEDKQIKSDSWEYGLNWEDYFSNYYKDATEICCNWWNGLLAEKQKELLLKYREQLLTEATYLTTLLVEMEK